MTGVLDFLSPSLAVDDRGFYPVARSAVERLYAAAGATFEERDGWRLAVSVPDEANRLGAVGIADLSHLGTLEVSPAPSAAVEESLQHSVTSAVTYRLSPRRALVFFPETARAGVTAALGADAHALDATAAYTILAISGPQARTLVARLTHLHHFPSGGEVAHVTAHVLPAGSGFRIVVAQELGHYLAEVALDCAVALGGGLVGVDALPAEERP
jgi:glycine cleavage system aminomethyltransferase T